MQNKATRYMADFIHRNQLSVTDISRKLHIPYSQLIPGTAEFLDADDFLRLCCYLDIQPEAVQMAMAAGE